MTQEFKPGDTVRVIDAAGSAGHLTLGDEHVVERVLGGDVSWESGWWWMAERFEQVKHGTYMTYFHRKCRCDECRRYQRERVARNRAERLARGVVHGSRSSYDAGCRCDSCVAARRKSYARERAAYQQGKEQS